MILRMDLKPMRRTVETRTLLELRTMICTPTRMLPLMPTTKKTMRMTTTWRMLDLMRITKTVVIRISPKLKTILHPLHKSHLDISTRPPSELTHHLPLTERSLSRKPRSNLTRPRPTTTN